MYTVLFCLLVKQDTHQPDYNHMKVVWWDWMDGSPLIHGQLPGIFYLKIFIGCQSFYLLKAKITLMHKILILGRRCA